jgi:protein TonB
VTRVMMVFAAPAMPAGEAADLALEGASPPDARPWPSPAADAKATPTSLAADPSLETVPEPVLPSPGALAERAISHSEGPKPLKRVQPVPSHHAMALAKPEQPTAPNRPPGPIAATWQHSLAAWLAAHKTYPEAARRGGKEGVVVVRFSVDRSGKVLDIAVIQSAGATVLDDAAEALLRGATLPPLPTDMTQDHVTITVQIHYALAS